MRLRGTTGTSIKRDRVGDGCRHLSNGMDRMFACQHCGEAQTSRARSRPAAAPGAERARGRALSHLRPQRVPEIEPAVR
jgi:hypothetical protein